MIFALGTKLLLALGVGDKLAKRFAWAPALILAALMVFLVMRIAANWFGQALDTAAEAGATGAVVAGQNQTLDQLGDANNAEQDIRRAPERDARLYAGCLLDARPGTEDRCERYNPSPRPE